MKSIEEIKIEIILYQLQYPNNKGLEYFNFIRTLPCHQEILDFIVDICPLYWCYLYAKVKNLYSLKLEDMICEKEPFLVLSLAQTHGGSDKFRKAINKSEDPALILEYAKIIDERYIHETFLVLEELARENKISDSKGYFKLYCDHFHHP